VLGPKAKIDLHRVPPLVVDLLPGETVPGPLTEKIQTMRGSVRQRVPPRLKPRTQKLNDTQRPSQRPSPRLKGTPRVADIQYSIFKTSVQMFRGAPQIQTPRLLIGLGTRLHRSSIRFKCSATSTVQCRHSSFIRAAPVDGHWASASSTRFVPTVVSGNLPLPFENNPSTRPALLFMKSSNFMPQVEQARGSSDSPVGRLQHWQRGLSICHSAQIASAWTPGEIIPLPQRSST
jgi:hypothetical protein